MTLPMGPGAALFVAISLLTVVGCGGEASPLAWSISFQEATQRDETAIVAVRVLRGGCMGMEVYAANINLLAGGVARDPMDELESGTYGFEATAIARNCSTVSTVCDPYDLPLEQTQIETVLPAMGGGGGGCRPGTDCDGSGSCLPIAPGDSSVPLPCDNEDAVCDDGAGGAMGICHDGACCLGCWDGSACQVGSTPAACGAMGDACEVCDPGDSCQGTMCATTSTNPRFSLSPRSNLYRHSDGRYWANAYFNPGPPEVGFRQTGPVSGAEHTLKGYTGALRFADLAAAEVASAGVERGTGNLYTWGTNAAGALGNGSSMATMVVDAPTQIDTLNTYRAVTAGALFFCAIRTDGTLHCWGTNVRGQLGTGNTTSQRAPTPVGTQRWISVAAGYEHACGIRDDRSLWCWGNGEDGRLGDGMAIDRSSPVRVGTDADWVEVAPGVGHTCGIRAAGGDRNLYCWGRAMANQLGIGDPGATTSFPIPEMVGPNGWQHVSAGNFHTCGLLDRGSGVEAYCWGFPGFGALGLGDRSIEANVPTPVDLTPNTGWQSITCGTDQTCGIADGTPYCWGDSRGDDAFPAVEGWLGVGMQGPMAIVESPLEVVFDPTLP